MQSLELKVPPVALALIAALSMWLATWLLPSLTFETEVTEVWLVLAVGLGCGGLAFALAGVVAFRRAITTVDPTRPGTASSIVTSGVYGLSRNPMYVGMLLVLTGWAMVLSHVVAWAVVPCFVAYMNRFQIAPEERALSARFGDAYRRYVHEVRRWL